MRSDGAMYVRQRHISILTATKSERRKPCGWSDDHKVGQARLLDFVSFVSLFQVGPNGGEQAGKISGDKQESDQGSPNFFGIPSNAQSRTVLSILMILLF